MGISKEAWISIVVSLVLTVAAASSSPWWWHLIFPSSPAQPSAIAGMSGGCAPYQVYAQNRWAPYGTAIREQPNVLSAQVGSEPGNMSLSVNGWVYGRAAYPTSTPPWNSEATSHPAMTTAGSGRGVCIAAPVTWSLPSGRLSRRPDAKILLEFRN